MFKRSRRRIVVTIMTILVLLWVGTLSVIYASSYWDMSKRNEEMLKMHAERYTLSQPAGTPVPPFPPFPNGSDFADSPTFRLSTFYTVAIAYDGAVLEIKNEPPTVHTDDDLERLAQTVAAGKKQTGRRNNLVFYKTDKGSYTLVTFKDDTVVNENAVTLFRYTLLFGGLALVLFFFLSVFLARKIVAPLEESHHKQKQFVSDAGHELKTPVSVIGANAELLAREIGDNRWLANIQYENERMGVLVAQLLDLARTENAALPTEPIDLSRLVAGEVLPFESVAFEKGVSLHSNIENGVAVTGNTAGLKQLISILLDNALAHGQGNTVALSLRNEHGHAVLSVINGGEEIPADQRSNLFERFWRVDVARSGDGTHYGLGLAIAKAVVTAHGGRIDVFCYDGLIEFRVQLPLS